MRCSRRCSKGAGRVFDWKPASERVSHCLTEEESGRRCGQQRGEPSCTSTVPARHSTAEPYSSTAKQCPNPRDTLTHARFNRIHMLEHLPTYMAGPAKKVKAEALRAVARRILTSTEGHHSPSDVSHYHRGSSTSYPTRIWWLRWLPSRQS